MYPDVRLPRVELRPRATRDIRQSSCRIKCLLSRTFISHALTSESNPKRFTLNYYSQFTRSLEQGWVIEVRIEGTIYNLLLRAIALRGMYESSQNFFCLPETGYSTRCLRQLRQVTVLFLAGLQARFKFKGARTSNARSQERIP
jgi:hypothetical protein